MAHSAWQQQEFRGRNFLHNAKQNSATDPLLKFLILKPEYPQANNMRIDVLPACVTQGHQQPWFMPMQDKRMLKYDWKSKYIFMFYKINAERRRITPYEHTVA